MSDRRGQPRFAVLYSWEAGIRVLRDVTVQKGRDERELVMISTAPVPVDEVMTLDLRAAGLMANLKVQVIESRPILVGGQMRHQVRLAVAGGVVDGVDMNIRAVPATGV
jgi:hypothetical protein